MTAPTGRRAGRPDIDTWHHDYLLLEMRKHVREAEAAQLAYVRRDQELRLLWLDAGALASRMGDDVRLNNAARLLAHHRGQVALYSSALQGEAAFRALTDRPVPPDGRRPGTPGSAAAALVTAAGESAADRLQPAPGTARPGAGIGGAGVVSGPRPVVPAAPGARPGAGQVKPYPGETGRG